jgi:hypothetical protein
VNKSNTIAAPLLLLGLGRAMAGARRDRLAPRAPAFISVVAHG